MADIRPRRCRQPLGGREIFAEAAGLKNVQTLFNLEATARERCGPNGRPRREQVPVAVDAEAARWLVRQPGGTRCPAAKLPFTPIGLTTVAHAAVPSPRISTVT